MIHIAALEADVALQKRGQKFGTDMHEGDAGASSVP